MKEEIKRIMRLVQEGKLSPEDAAELIDAFQSGEAEAQPEAESESPRGDTAQAAKEPFKSFMDTIENLGREVSENVNWQDVARQVREGAKKGVDQLKVGIEKIKKEGRFNFDLFTSSETRQVELPLNLEKGKLLRIENPVGNVTVTGGKGPSQVRATAKVRGLDQEEAARRAEAYTLVVEESDHTVQIRQPDVSGLSVDLDVQVPVGADLEVRTLAGNIRVSNTEGAAKVNAQSGQIVLEKLDGVVEIVSQSGSVSVERVTTPALSLESRSGSVRLKGIRGNMNIRTASGELVVAESSGKTVSIESVSGDVTVDLDEPVSGAVSIRTVNGESNLSIPDGSDCRVSLSTLRGSVVCGLDLDDEQRADQHVTGRLGDGQGTLDVSAVNGSITMKLRNHATL